MDFDGGMHGILITAKNRDVLEFSFHCLLFRWDDINFVFLLLVGYWIPPLPVVRDGPLPSTSSCFSSFLPFSLPSIQIRSDLICNLVSFDSVIIILHFVEHS